MMCEERNTLRCCVSPKVVTLCFFFFFVGFQCTSALTLQAPLAAAPIEGGRNKGVLFGERNQEKGVSKGKKTKREIREKEHGWPWAPRAPSFHFSPKKKEPN